MSNTLTIRLGSRLAHALEEESRQTGLKRGEIVRQALESRLTSKGNLMLLQQAFGMMEGPSDLSTNKKYRRSWNKR